MSKFNLSRTLFDFEEYDSDNSDKSVIYISSSEDESSEWETDCSTDTEQLIARIEREVTSSPMLIGGRVMTMDEPEDEARAGPSTSQMEEWVTPKLGLKYFDREMCYAPPRKFEKKRIELCNTIMPVLESPMSPPEHERGPGVDTPLLQATSSNFHASYHVQNTVPYQNVSEVRYTGCMVCGRSVDSIKDEKVKWYMQRSTPRDEPEYITRLRKEAYENGLNAGCFLFITPAVSQAAACDGTTVTTSANGQEFVPGTLPFY